MELSPRQREILEFVNSHVDAHGYPPTVREIGGAVGLTSPSTVHAHLARLETAGLIRRDPTKPRALEVIEGGRSRERTSVAVESPPRTNVLPLMGDVAAGTGLVADQQVEDMVAVPDQLCSDADFLLTVKGESMINAGILPGDFVVVRKQDDARNGEIVVALVGDEDATVKRFFRESGRVRLQPENDEMEAMYPEQVRILGTVKAVLRRL
ncbi:MAG: repressor LexA [Gaiellales bacterium]|nr:repressor LexA [Gaiellales bacterium]